MPSHLRPEQAELLPLLQLSRTAGIGPVTCRELLRRFGNASAALAALPTLTTSTGKPRNFVPPALPPLIQEMQRLAAAGGQFLGWDNASYPAALRDIPDAPPLLALLGKAELLTRPMIAIVGARNASLNGKKMAEQLAVQLGATGYVVVSGLARGIDGAAHQAALATGTIGVVAGGVDQIYPPEHEKLFAAMRAQGCIISDMPWGTEPMANLFPRRNRIIAGLCMAVVVVEAATQSGSLLTANLARDYGREIMAVPGSPLDGRCHGSNWLIKQGATLVESARDVLAQLPPLPTTQSPYKTIENHIVGIETDSNNLTAGVAAQLLELLSIAPISVDELLRGCQFSAPQVNAALVELELDGHIQRLPGNQVCRLASRLG